MFIPSPHSTLRIYMLVTRPEDREELEASRLENSSFHTESRDNRTTLLDVMQRQVPNVLKPYTLKIKQVRWISKYIVAQRVIEHFTDGKRCLFVGDSCHSHSPKAGQGMNTGIQDAYNLAWKLALVIRGRADPSLLETYDTERKHIAHQLIDFDAKFASRFSDQSQIESPEFFNLWKEGQGFTSGLQHQYPPNPALSDAQGAKINPSALEPLVPGKRLLPMSLTRHIDGMPVTTLDTMPANGEFHTVLFAGDISSPERQKAFHSLYAHLTSATSPLTTHNGLPPSPSRQSYPWPASDAAMSSRPAADGPHSWPLSHIHFNADHDADSSKVLNLQVVHTADRFEVDLQPDFQLWKYNFYEDEEGKEHVRHGVDPEGPMQLAVVRPDGFVAMVRSADGDGKVLEEVTKYLEACGLRALKKDS